MRIALCTQQFGNYWSGLGTYSTLLVKGLIERGHEISVITPGDVVTDLNVTTIPVSSLNWDPTHGGWFSLSFAYNKALVDLKVDIVHFTDAREAYSYTGNIPAIGTLHDDYFARHSWIPWAYRAHYVDWIKRYAYYSFVTCTERRALRRLQGLIANSDCTAATITKRYSIDPDKVQTIYIQPDLKLEPLGADIEQKRLENPTLLFAGGNIQRKGLPLLLNALVQLKDRFPNLSLRILGKNQNLDRMQALSRKMGLSERVHFEGWVHPREMSKYYLESAVFVMPSLMEGYGLVFLEAMSHQLPVIAGNVGGTRELIRHKENGLLVDPHNVEALASSITDLLEDKTLRSTLITGGSATIRDLDLEKMINATTDFYQNVLGTQ